MTPTTPDVEYAYWAAPDASFTVTYSLGVFHEIDFQVNEGYRRIPHGGIEIGGLLFGRSEASSARIEAFRVIECEHAAGPSFMLSPRDLAALREQLAAAKTDPELADLETLGWFVAHTRSPLRMSDREAALFDELFPQTGQIAALVKPQRFQPTRFGFLVRGADGNIPRDATQNAIILPLPGRATRSADGPVASIPAPEERPAAEPARTAPAPPPQPPSPQERIAPALPPEPEPAPEASPEAVIADEQPSLFIEPEPAPDRSASFPAPEPTSEPVPQPSFELPPQPMPPLPEPAAARIDASAPAEQAEPPEEIKSLVPFSRPESLPSIDEIRRRRSERLQSTDLMVPPAYEGLDRPPAHSNLRLPLVLLVAAVLGCAVGYWAYLQLPSATIPLRVRALPAALVISWPPEQTRDAVYAAIRIDDGQQAPLSPEQKDAGQAMINPTSDNVKVELIAQHWMRDSRGIVRYVRAAPAQSSGRQ